MKYKSIQIRERDIKLFSLLDKFHIIDKNLASKFLGFTTSSAFNRRVKKLEDFGYLDSRKINVNSEKVYFLTQKGMNILYPPEVTISKAGNEYFKNKKTPGVSVFFERHELTVAEVAFYIMRDNNFDIEQIISHREQVGIAKNEKRKNAVISDIGFVDYNVKIEIELTTKQNNIMQQKFDKCNVTGDFYIWVIPKNRTSLRERIEKEAERGNLHSFIFLEDIAEEKIDIQKFHDMTRQNILQTLME